MSCIVSMAKRTIPFVVCCIVVGCSSGPNQPSSNLVPVSVVASVPGTTVDEAKWNILERIAIGEDFEVDGVTFRKLDDYISARKSRCFRVISINQTVPERDYQVLCHGAGNSPVWYMANQVLANETGVAHD